MLGAALLKTSGSPGAVNSPRSRDSARPWLAFKIVALAFGWIVVANARTHGACRRGSAEGNAGEEEQSGERQNANSAYDEANAFRTSARTNIAPSVNPTKWAVFRSFIARLILMLTIPEALRCNRNHTVALPLWEKRGGPDSACIPIRAAERSAPPWGRFPYSAENLKSA